MTTTTLPVLSPLARKVMIMALGHLLLRPHVNLWMACCDAADVLEVHGQRGLDELALLVGTQEAPGPLRWTFNLRGEGAVLKAHELIGLSIRNEEEQKTKAENYAYIIDLAQKGEMGGRPFLCASTEADARNWLRVHAKLDGDGPVWRDEHGATYTIKAVPRIIPATLQGTIMKAEKFTFSKESPTDVASFAVGLLISESIADLEALLSKADHPELDQIMGRGVLTAVANWLTGQGMSPEDVAVKLERFAARIRSGEARELAVKLEEEVYKHG